MGGENVERLKQCYYDPALIGFIALLDPDIVWESPDFLDQGTYKGRKALFTSWRISRRHGRISG